MNADDLTTEQARKIGDAIGPTLGYLSRLRQRMDRKRVPPDDKLRQLTAAACDALHHLTVELHYRGFGEGVGRAPTKQPIRVRGNH